MRDFFSLGLSSCTGQRSIKSVTLHCSIVWHKLLVLTQTVLLQSYFYASILTFLTKSYGNVLSFWLVHNRIFQVVTSAVKFLVTYDLFLKYLRTNDTTQTPSCCIIRTILTTVRSLVDCIKRIGNSQWNFLDHFAIYVSCVCIQIHLNLNIGNIC